MLWCLIANVLCFCCKFCHRTVNERRFAASSRAAVPRPLLVDGTLVCGRKDRRDIPTIFFDHSTIR